MSEHRKERLAILLRKELSQLFSRERYVHNVWVTITRVQVSDGLRSATVLFTTIPKEAAEETRRALTEQVLTIQRDVRKRIRLRTMPRLRFSPDVMEEEIMRVEELIDTLEPES